MSEWFELQAFKDGFWETIARLPTLVSASQEYLLRKPQHVYPSDLRVVRCIVIDLEKNYANS